MTVVTASGGGTITTHDLGGPGAALAHPDGVAASMIALFALCL